MQDLDIQQRLHLLQKEIEAAASLISETKLDLVSSIDALKIDMEVLKIFMERYHADFARLYPSLREETIQEIDPEWLQSRAKERSG